jgi:hypothetical protein
MAKVERQTDGIQVLVNSLIAVNGLSTKVGWFDGSKYENGMPVAYAAAISEFGYPEGGIPKRSFMRTTISEKQSSWKNLAKSGAKAILAGNVDARAVMEGLGLQAAGDIKKKISQINSPALKPGTIAARKNKLAKGKKVGGLTKPLVETGLLLASLSSAVTKK